jgi:serine/threonine-protein kinase
VSEAEAGRLFRGVLAGVAEAHGIGLVHRDLKPANVLVASGPRGRIPKVADFGLAKVLMDEQPDAPHLTRSGTAMGTPAYMAPEQIRNARRVDHRADIFSLGCILYELMSGRRPFAGEDMLSVFNAVASGEHAPLPHLPPATQLAIRGALRVSPEDRIPSCDILLEVLDGARTEWGGAVPRPTTAAPSTIAPPVVRAAAAAPGTWSDAAEDDADGGAAPPMAAPGSGGGGLGVVAAGASAGVAAATFAGDSIEAVVEPGPTLAPGSVNRSPVDSASSIEVAPPARPAPHEVAPHAAPRAAWLPWAAGVGGLVIVGLIAARVLSPAAPPPVAEVPEAAGSPTAAVAPSGAAPPAAAPVPPAAPPPVEPVGSGADGSPAGVKPVVAPPPGGATRPGGSAGKGASAGAGDGRPPDTSAARATPSATTAAPAVERAPLVVTCPGATVSVDGQAQAKKGMARVEVTVGSHRVTCQAEGAPVSRDVVVTAGEGRYFCWDFDVGAPCT